MWTLIILIVLLVFVMLRNYYNDWDPIGDGLCNDNRSIFEPDNDQYKDEDNEFED